MKVVATSFSFPHLPGRMAISRESLRTSGTDTIGLSCMLSLNSRQGALS